MAQYLVEWLIDIDADSPEEAAVRALITQRDPESTAVMFTVTKPDGSKVNIDLAEEAEGFTP